MRAKKSIRAWIARDRNSRIFLYRNKPKKSINEWIGPSASICSMPSDAFPNVKWEDSEPTRVYIRIA